jgi:hypothetical protein
MTLSDEPTVFWKIALVHWPDELVHYVKKAQSTQTVG